MILKIPKTSHLKRRIIVIIVDLEIIRGYPLIVDLEIIRGYPLIVDLEIF